MHATLTLHRCNSRPGSSVPRFGAERRLNAPTFWTNLKDFLTERSVRVPRSAQQEVFRSDGLDSSFSESFKAFFQPAPQLKAGAADSE